MLGTYSARGNFIQFRPMFPLDPGRQYRVVFTPPGQQALVATVGLPALAITPSTVVSHVFPSSDVVPANQLRLYIHFSAPMGREGGLPFITLLDDTGKTVVDPFLPLDAEFWNDDHTRYTVFFDPGRQKRGILPNQQMGRSLEPGKRYRLVVSREWRDGNGLPLKEDFTREFRVAEPDERPLDTAAWRLMPPPAGTREPLRVEFDGPLDHGLLLRALGVTGSDGKFLDGDVKVEAGESRWSFTPSHGLDRRHLQPHRPRDARGPGRQPHRPRVRSRQLQPHGRVSRTGTHFHRIYSAVTPRWRAEGRLRRRGGTSCRRPRRARRRIVHCLTPAHRLPRTPSHLFAPCTLRASGSRGVRAAPIPSSRSAAHSSPARRASSSLASFHPTSAPR